MKLPSDSRGRIRKKKIKRRKNTYYTKRHVQEAWRLVAGSPGEANISAGSSAFFSPRGKRNGVAARKLAAQFISNSNNSRTHPSSMDSVLVCSDSPTFNYYAEDPWFESHLRVFFCDKRDEPHLPPSKALCVMSDNDI